MVGCRFNAKNTLDKNYLYLAEKLGVEILPEQEVQDIRSLDRCTVSVHQSSDQPVSFDVEFEPQRAAAVVPWQGELQVIDLTEKLFERFTFGHSSNRFEAHYDVSLA